LLSLKLIEDLADQEAHRELAPELLPLEELKDCWQMIYI
jgi:hypothetical protein